MFLVLEIKKRISVTGQESFLTRSTLCSSSGFDELEYIRNERMPGVQRKESWERFAYQRIGDLAHPDRPTENHMCRYS